MAAVSERTVTYAVAQHYVDSPAHAFTQIVELEGRVKSLLTGYPDDPAIAAYQIRDTLRQIRPIVDRLTNWSNAVISGDPSDVPHKGAKC